MMNCEVICNGYESHLEKVPSRTDITIGLEDEKGEQKPVDIDEVDEVITQEQSQTDQQSTHLSTRRVSITEQVLKSKNTEQTLHGLEVQAMSRKQQFVALLQEHEQIVKKVHRMESKEHLDSSPDKENHSSSDKENQQQPPPPPQQQQQQQQPCPSNDTDHLRQQHTSMSRAKDCDHTR